MCELYTLADEHPSAHKYPTCVSLSCIMRDTINCFVCFLENVSALIKSNKMSIQDMHGGNSSSFHAGECQMADSVPICDC